LCNAETIAKTVYNALNELAKLYEDATHQQEEHLNELLNEKLPFEVDIRELADDCKKWYDEISYKVWHEKQSRKIGENTVEIYEALKLLVKTGTFYNVSKEAIDNAERLINKIG